MAKPIRAHSGKSVLACVFAVLVAGCATTQGQRAAAVAPQAAAATGSTLPFAPGFVRETRIVYPLEVDGWTAIDEHVYDDQALGVMVRYANGDGETRLDVFYYPAGALLEEQVRAAAEEQRKGIALARTQAGDPTPDLGTLRDFAIPLPASDPLEGHSLDALVVSGGETYNSAMVQVHRALYFVKARMSQPAGDRDRAAVRGELEAFMATLVPQLQIVNTGSCARELPIEAWTGNAPPGDAMVTVENGGSLAWVLRDRVVASDPASEQALLARTVGMAFQGRLPPDCMGADPIQPLVVAGMREIRIEYPGEA